VKGRASFGAYVDEPGAASGAWVKEDTYVVKQSFTETPFALTTTLRYSGAELSCTMETNVGFGATKKPALTGTVE